jgi:hypothetical protein
MRILISDDYYPALDSPDVDLITDDVTEITERGVRTADGAERQVDAIVYGTGFRVQDLLTPLSIVGRDGADLNDVWRERGLQAYKGTAIAGFPNLFMLLGPNTGLGHSSMVFMAECQIAYVIDALKTTRDAIEVTPEAEEAYNAEIQGRLTEAVWSRGGCRSDGEADAGLRAQGRCPSSARRGGASCARRCGSPSRTPATSSPRTRSSASPSVDRKSGRRAALRVGLVREVPAPTRRTRGSASRAAAHPRPVRWARIRRPLLVDPARDRARPVGAWLLHGRRRGRGVAPLVRALVRRALT